MASFVMLVEWAPTGPVRPVTDELAARLVLGYGCYPEDAVRTAAELVAEGVDVDVLVQPASQPADVNALDSQEVEILFRSALAEVGSPTAVEGNRRVTLARPIATALVEGEIRLAQALIGYGACRVTADTLPNCSRCSNSTTNGNRRSGPTVPRSRPRSWHPLPRS